MRPQDEHGSKQAARGSRGVRDGAERKSDQEGRGNDGQRRAAGENALGNRVPAANQIGREPPEGPDGGADQGAAEIGARKDQPTRGRARCNQQSVIGDGQKTREGPECKIERSRFGVAVAEPTDIEVRRIAEEQARDPDGGGGCAEGGNGDPALESLHQFLEDENGAGDRRVEGCAQARAGSGRNQHPAVRPASAKYLSDKMSEACAHLDGRAFPAEREASADREQAAEELDRNQAKRDRRKLATQNGFDMRDAAPRRVGGVATNQPSGNCGRACANRNDQEEAGGLLAMSPSDQRIAKLVGLPEGETEDRSDEPRNRAANEREQRERQ